MEKVIHKKKTIQKSEKTEKIGKITVKHFLNKGVEPFIEDGVEYFPIYIRITAKRQGTTIKSLFQNFLFSERDFPFNDEDYLNLMEVEKKLIIESANSTNILSMPDFNITQISKRHSKFIKFVELDFDWIVNKSIETEFDNFLAKNNISKKDWETLFGSDLFLHIEEKKTTFFNVFKTLIPELEKYQNINEIKLILDIVDRNKVAY